MFQTLGRPRVLSVLLVLVVAAGCTRQSVRKTSRAERSAPPASALASDSAGQPQGRPRIYPYSVVQGGVHSVADFYRKPDRLARTHYAGLRPIGIVKNPQASLWYVSFRKNGSIFWTRRRLRIPAGEKLMELAGSDKIAFARTRCGNLLSKDPQGPNLPEHEEVRTVAEAEQPVPDIAVNPDFVKPLIPDDLKAAIELPVPTAGTVGGGEPAGSRGQSALGDPSGGEGGSGFGGARRSEKTGKQMPVTATPEPAEYSLVLGGLASLGLLSVHRRRRRTAKIKSEMSATKANPQRPSLPI